MTKDKGETPLIEWSIVKHVPPYQGGSKMPALPSRKNVHLTSRQENLNKRSELVSKCRHINKFLLKKVFVINRLLYFSYSIAI